MNSLSFGLLGSGGGDFINLDFGASSIKIAQGTYTDGENPSIDLNMADREPVGNPAPNERVTEFSSALKALLQRNSITEEQKTVLALPTNIVIVRHLELPAMPDERMSQVIRYEAESHIPFPLEEVVLDHHVIERTEDGTEIILIAVKEEKLNEYVEIAHNAGLNPEIIDISAFSLFNLYRKMGSLDDVSSNGGEDDSSKVLVDIGHANTDIIIFKGETLHFARSASVAGESITEQIAKKLGVEIDEAQSLKHEHGHIPLEDIDETEFEDEEEGALEDIAEKKESPDSDTEEDTGDLGEEGAGEGGEGGGLDLGTPAGPSGGQTEETSDEDSGPDSSGLDLGSPKSPGESDDSEEATEPEDSAEPEQSEQSEEPSEPEEPTPPSPDEEESGPADESPAGGVAPDASIEDEDDEDSGGGIDLGLGESWSPGESPEDETESDEQASEPPEPGSPGEGSQVDEEQSEPDAAGEADDELDSGDSMSSDEADAGEESGDTETQDTEAPPAPEESEPPEPPTPGETDEEDESPAPPEPGETDEDSEESAPPPPDEAEEDDTPSAPPEPESAEDTDDTPPPPEDSTTDEETGEDESAPPPPGASDEDDQPPAPSETDTTEDTEEPPAPPAPDEQSSEDESEEDEDLSLGSSPPPSEETPEEDTEDDDEGGDLNLGSTLDKDEKDEDEEDDDDDGSSLTLGAAENNDEDADADPEPDVDRDKIGRAIKPQIDRLIGELRHTFDYFQSQLGGGEVDEVIIVGGGSNLKNLAAYVEDQLDRPAKRFHPVDQVSGVPEEDLQEYLVSTGLTLRTMDDVADLEINLIPEDIIQQRQSRNVQQKITAMGVLGGLLLVQLLGSAYLFYDSRYQHYKVSQNEMDKLEEIVTRIEDLKENQREMNQRNEVIQRLEDQRTDMLALMNELDQLPPELPKTTTWFNRFNYSVSGENTGQLNISGVTGDFDDTSRLYQWLESIEYIQDITDQSQSKNTYTFGDQEQSLVSFSATCSVSFATGSDQGGGGEGPG